MIVKQAKTSWGEGSAGRVIRAPAVGSRSLLSAPVVKRRVDLLGYVSRFVRLRQRGENFFGLCPFHEERHPSFAVRPDYSLWYCFGCQRGGDVFTFEMLRSGCDFPEAVRRVAEKSGLVSICAAGDGDLLYEPAPKAPAKRGAR